MRTHHPEAIVLAPERVQARALRHVPNAYAFILRVAHDELLARVKHDARHIVVVSAAGVDLPGLRICT